MSPTVSPDGRWVVYVPMSATSSTSGPAFAARAAERLEAMRLDRPDDPPVPLHLDLPGLTGQPAFSRDGKFLYVTQFFNDTNGDGAIDASDHGVLFRVPFESGARRRAGARAAAAWPMQLTESTWNCQYPSPAATLLVATCSRHLKRPRRLQPAARRRGARRLERRAARGSRSRFSVRESEQLLLYRHLFGQAVDA